MGKPRPRILDVGCGTGANLQMLAEFGAAEGVDVSAEALDFCRARGLGAVRQGAAESLPYGDTQFDLVTGLDVVEHLDDDVAGLSEMFRVLRPGGRVLLFVPALMFLWGVQDDVSHHRRRYTLAELKEKLGAAGLAVERASYRDTSFFCSFFFRPVFIGLSVFCPPPSKNIKSNLTNGPLWALLR